MKKVLIIDDINTVSKTYFDLLYKNYQVEGGIDAEEIVQRAKRFKPDIVIVNSHLPGFDAHEVCDVIAYKLKLPIILLITKDSSTTLNIDSCKTDEIITKPFEKEVLLETIKRLLAING